MKIEILVLVKDFAPQMEQLSAISDIAEVHVGKAAAELLPFAETAKVLLTWGGKRDEILEIMKAAPGLEWIHSRSAGLDGALFPELVQSNIVLTNSRGVFARPLAEFAALAVLYFLKDVPRLRRNQQAGNWEQFPCDEAGGKRIGIFGYGAIGKQCAKLFKALGMSVVALRRHPDKSGSDPLIDRTYSAAEKLEFLKELDFLLITSALTPETRGAIGTQEIASLSPRSVLINIGRGPIVDEQALLRALRERKIRGAALDVFNQEPLPANHEFYELENVLLSPHCADQTDRWLDDAMSFFISNARRFAAKQPLENVVRKELGY